MSERDRSPATLPTRRAAEAPRHVRRDARLVDKNERFRVEIELALEPFLSRRGDIVPLLLRSVARLLLARDPMAREELNRAGIAGGHFV
jgi:hypothetical protein